MVKKIVLFSVLGLIVAAGAMFMLNREGLFNFIDGLRGYPKAKTPQECVDLFNKAIADRQYDKAAKYCNKDYAEQLKKAHDAAHDLGKALDDLRFRLNQNGLDRDAVTVVLDYHDPFHKTIKASLASNTDDTATINFTGGQSAAFPTGWEYDQYFVKALYMEQGGSVSAKKEDGAWKMQFIVNELSRARIDHLVKVYKNYTNAFKKFSEELRVEATTKNEVEGRLKTLISEAAREK